MRFESTIAACHRFRALPMAIDGPLPKIRAQLIAATGATRFQVRNHDRRVMIAATGEHIGYMTQEESVK